MRKFLNIYDMQNLAEQKKGKCLSTKYINTSTKLEWQCDKGHIWKATPASIISGSWCPICKGWHKTIKDMQHFAEQKKGKCLSTKYINSQTKLKWQCSEGHIWEAKPMAVINFGTWCPVCAKHKITIPCLQKLAKQKQGKCLSNEYIDQYTKLKWQCKEKHTWKASLKNIRRGTWCPICAKYKTKYNITIKDMQAIAKCRGGKCLSKKYINSYTKLKWQCKEGHIWEAIPSNIKSGRWCPICSRIKLTIKDMQELAKTKNGKCLSKKYINKHTKLKWQCSKRHIWEASPENIKQGRWCPRCARYKLTIEDMQMLAKQKNGKCLSARYINSHTKLIWQCDKGHIWKTKPHNIVAGTWCPACAKNKRYKK